MTYSVYCGLHSFMREDFETAAEALAQLRAWDKGGAKYLQVVGPDLKDLTEAELELRAAAETR